MSEMSQSSDMPSRSDASGLVSAENGGCYVSFDGARFSPSPSQLYKDSESAQKFVDSILSNLNDEYLASQGETRESIRDKYQIVGVAAAK
jgi:hypothetical protein